MPNIIWDGDEVIEMQEPKPCSICLKSAHYASTSFHASYCSKECLRKEWDGYFEAESKMP